MNANVFRAISCGVALGLALLLPMSVHAATAGQVTHLSGTLSVKKSDGSSKLLSVKSDVQEGDVLSTEAGTYARVKFVDGGELVMRPGTQIKVANYRFDEAQPKNDNVFISLLKGGLRAVTGLVGKRNHDAVSFSAATATIGIRGTHFGALLCKKEHDCDDVQTISGHPPRVGLHVDVADGAVLVRNRHGDLLLVAGKFGWVPDDDKPPEGVPPEEGVQVTMPASISQNNPSGMCQQQ